MLSVVIFLYVGMSRYVFVDKSLLCEDIVAGPGCVRVMYIAVMLKVIV